MFCGSERKHEKRFSCLKQPRGNEMNVNEEVKLNMAFISRHTPTQEQMTMAEEEGFILHHIGDVDAFRVEPEFVHLKSDDKGIEFEAVAVVHPAAALRLFTHFIVGVFENANRSPVGELLKFEAIRLHIYDLR